MNHYTLQNQNSDKMVKQSFTLLLVLAFLFAGCQSEGNKGNKDEADMSQFAGDESFRDSHELPGEASPSGAGEMMEFSTADGKAGSAYVLTTEEESKDYLLVLHEWWGLNDHIKQEAERLFEGLENVNVMALDLYDGRVAKTREEAGKLMEGADEARIRVIIQGAIDKAGPDSKIATVGWCFGGGWSLKASIMAGEQGAACAMYYGMPVQDEEAIAPLEAPILAIFALEDEWITPAVAKSFIDLAGKTGKQLQLRSFTADHAFANPSSPRYDQQASQQANKEVLAFLKANL